MHPSAIRLLPALLATLSCTALAQGAPCPAADDLVPISAVQGSGDRSPLTGREVHVEGVITAAFTARGQLGGVFLQSERGDDDAATSDAVWVRTRGARDERGTALTAGDRLRVRGTVRERSGMTQIDALTELRDCGRGALPGPVPVTLPMDRVRAWEPLEGMLVRLEDATVTEVYDLGRYGRVTLADRRLFVPAQGVPVDAIDAPQRRIVLDDGAEAEDPRPVPLTLQDGLPPRVGDRVPRVTAVVTQVGLDAYRLQPVHPPEVVRERPRPDAPPAVGGRLRVASFNVHNFFTTLGDRGAADDATLALQRAKLVAALRGLDADVVALQEVENDGGATAAALVRALDEAVGGPVYAAVPDPASGTGDDAITQVLLYRPGRLALLGSASDPSPIHDRPPIAATFREVDGGAIFTVVSVHLKSKGGCPPAGDTDVGFGCWNLRRSAQAEAVVAFANALARATQDPDVLVMGDLNSYLGEPPLQRFTRAGYHDLDRLVPADRRYSYVYYGASGTLDYALASPALAPQVTGAALWHINADESPLLDADTRYDPPAMAHPDAFRSSDHDPVLVGITLR